MNNIIDIYLVGGQSNADGRQSSPTNPYAEVDGTLTGLRMYNWSAGGFGNWKIGANNGGFTVTSSEWDPMGVALKQYRDWLGVDLLYVVKTTRGGVSMAPEASNTGSFYWDTTQVIGESKMYDLLRTRIEAVRSTFARQGKVTRFKAMLWHQGESDYLEPYASAYQSTMTTFIRKVRELCWNPTMPWIWGNISSASGQYSPTVRAAQNSITAADPNIYLVNLEGQPLFDAYHFNAVGKEYFGDQMFEILKTI